MGLVSLIIGSPRWSRCQLRLGMGQALGGEFSLPPFACSRGVGQVLVHWRCRFPSGCTGPGRRLWAGCSSWSLPAVPPGQLPLKSWKPTLSSLYPSTGACMTDGTHEQPWQNSRTAALWYGCTSSWFRETPKIEKKRIKKFYSWPGSHGGLMSLVLMYGQAASHWSLFITLASRGRLTQAVFTIKPYPLYRWIVLDDAFDHNTQFIYDHFHQRDPTHQFSRELLPSAFPRSTYCLLSPRFARSLVSLFI